MGLCRHANRVSSPTKLTLVHSFNHRLWRTERLSGGVGEDHRMIAWTTVEMDSPLATAPDASEASSHRLVDCDNTSVHVHSEPHRVIAKDKATWSSARLPVLCSEGGIDASLMRRGAVEADDVYGAVDDRSESLEVPEEDAGWLDELSRLSVTELGSREMLGEVAH